MEPKTKKKDKLSIEQAQGIRLTERQFKALLITNILTGIISGPQPMTHQEILAKIPDVKENVEAVLTACILDPLTD